jgi:uncharacterized protein (TIRG00374 family)
MKKLVNFLVSALVAVALVAWLARYLDTDRLIQTLRGAWGGWLAVAAGMMGVYQLLRGLRIRLFFPGREAPAGKLFGLMCVQGFLNNILPSWLGDAALVYLLKRYHGMDLYVGAASVVATRIADLSFILLMFVALTALALDKAALPLLAITMGLGTLIAAGVALIAMMARYGSVGKAEGVWAARARESILKFSRSFGAIRGNRAIWAPLALYTAGMWLIQYLVFVAVVRALGQELSLFTMLGVYLVGFSENLLPIKGVASLGTYETAWYVALRIFGVDKSTSVLLGFGSHALMLAVITALAALGALILARGGGEKRD